MLWKVHSTNLTSAAVDRTAALLVIATALSYGVGWILAFPPLVPALNTLPALSVMIQSLRRGRTAEAVARMLVWAVTMGVCATLLGYAAPERTAHLFVGAREYQQEMFAWVLTGSGAESDPSQFVPLHLRHAALFCVLALLTGSVLAMPMGAVLMNYMGHYVGALAARAANPILIAALGWHPWALIRIASFVILGVVLGGPVLARVFGFPYDLRAQRRWLAVAGCGLLIDLVVKWMLAPVWQPMLRRAVGW